MVTWAPAINVKPPQGNWHMHFSRSHVASIASFLSYVNGSSYLSPLNAVLAKVKRKLRICMLFFAFFLVCRLPLKDSRFCPFVRTYGVSTTVSQPLLLFLLGSDFLLSFLLVLCYSAYEQPSSPTHASTCIDDACVKCDVPFFGEQLLKINCQ